MRAESIAKLPRALASYMSMVSVYHSAAHFSYATIPLDLFPMRLRTPRPDQETPTSLDLDKLVSP